MTFLLIGLTFDPDQRIFIVNGEIGMPEFRIVGKEHLKSSVDFPPSLALPDAASHDMPPEGVILAQEVKMVSDHIEPTHVGRTPESDQSALDIPAFKDAFLPSDLGKRSVGRLLSGDAAYPDY